MYHLSSEEELAYLYDTGLDATFIGEYFQAPQCYASCVARQMTSYNNAAWYANWSVEALFTYFLTHRPEP